MSHENGIFGTIIFVHSEPLAFERSINSRTGRSPDAALSVHEELSIAEALANRFLAGGQILQVLERSGAGLSQTIASAFGATRQCLGRGSLCATPQQDVQVHEANGRKYRRSKSGQPTF